LRLTLLLTFQGLSASIVLNLFLINNQKYYFVSSLVMCLFVLS